MVSFNLPKPSNSISEMNSDHQSQMQFVGNPMNLIKLVRVFLEMLALDTFSPHQQVRLD